MVAAIAPMRGRTPRILSPQELYKFSQRMNRVPLPLLPLGSPPQVLRVRVAELVVHQPGIALIKVSAEGNVPCAADRVRHPF